MKLSLYRKARISDPVARTTPKWNEQTVPDTLELVLSPNHPMLEVDASETAAMLDRPHNSEVLHVAVTREIKPGVKQIAHLHFSIGLNNRDQLVGEVVAMLGDEPPTRKTAVAKWRTPVNSDAS